MKKQITAAVILVIVFFGMIGIAYGLKHVNHEYTYTDYPLKYEMEVNAAAKKYKVDKALIYGVIKTESNFEPDAQSGVGALGLMQLMPDTFTWLQTYYREENNYSFEDLANPAVCIDYGVQLLSIFSQMYEVEDTMLCAYNGGPGNVDKWLSDPACSDDGKHLKVVPFPETDNYRKLVAQNKSIYKKLYFS